MSWASVGDDCLWSVEAGAACKISLEGLLARIDQVHPSSFQGVQTPPPLVYGEIGVLWEIDVNGTNISPHVLHVQWIETIQWCIRVWPWRGSSGLY